jgi:hypothetical protein
MWRTLPSIGGGEDDENASTSIVYHRSRWCVPVSTNTGEHDDTVDEIERDLRAFFPDVYVATVIEASEGRVVYQDLFEFCR